ncbi:MAG: ABC transporter ATP-binding protein [Chloroflexi bacterium]|nr:ABC transporter ATP-binding protein [Chloroflexota bacterium]
MLAHTASELNSSTQLQDNSPSQVQTDASPLVVSNLNKIYSGGFQANTDISLTANPGEILGILGPNGAGKTTLIRQITTELSPSSGDIQVMGRSVVSEPAEVKALLGIMPQETTLFDYLTVHQHLRIFAKLRGIPPKEAGKRADELAEDLDLLPHRNVAISKLSGGLKQRVLVGIAAISHPPVLVLDEPTTGLDPQSRRTLWSLLQEYQRSGAFVLLTTHSMEEAEALCDRVGIIKGGQLLALDTVDNLRASNGFEFKITYYPDGMKTKGTTIYGADDQELIAQVNGLGIQQFAVSRTTLEDIYLALTGGLDEFDDWSS